MSHSVRPDFSLVNPIQAAIKGRISAAKDMSSRSTEPDFPSGDSTPGHVFFGVNADQIFSEITYHQKVLKWTRDGQTYFIMAENVAGELLKHEKDVNAIQANSQDPRDISKAFIALARDPLGSCIALIKDRRVKAYIVPEDVVRFALLSMDEVAAANVHDKDEEPAIPKFERTILVLV